MRIYFNTSALSRPFDDLSSARTRLEAEAVVALLEGVENESREWIGADYLDFEVTQDPDRERVGRLQSLMALVKRRVQTSHAVASRARELERVGLRGLDAPRKMVSMLRAKAPTSLRSAVMNGAPSASASAA